MGSYKRNYFHSKDDAVKYYANGAKELSEEAAEFFNKNAVLQGECAFAKAKIFIDHLVDALEHEFK